MTYRELQKALKAHRDAGRTKIKLNAKKALLQAEYNRLTKSAPTPKTKKPMTPLKAKRAKFCTTDTASIVTKFSTPCDAATIEAKAKEILTYGLLDPLKLVQVGFETYEIYDEADHVNLLAARRAYEMAPWEAEMVNSFLLERA